MREARTLPPHRHATLRLVVLLTAAAFSTVRGVSYLLPRPATGTEAAALTYVEAWLPLAVWAWVWLLLAAALVAAAVLRDLAIPAMSLFVGLLTLWGGSYLASWLFLQAPRAWLSAATMCTTALFASVLTMLVERHPETRE